MYFGVTNSENFKSISLIKFTCLTSPSLSERNGIKHATALLFTFSQDEATMLKRAIVSLIRFILLSFQSFIFILINLARASITSCAGCICDTYSARPLKPSTLSCHFASSNKATMFAGKFSQTLASASSLLSPAPPSSSCI